LDYKGFSIPKDIYIFILIPVRIIIIRKKLKKTGFNKLLLMFNENNLTETADDVFILKLKKIYKASTFFLQKIFRDQNPCIIRTLLLYELCCKNIFKANIITGFYKENNDIKGHSWLEVNEKPLCEDQNKLNKFIVISKV
jgi:hypothetical protein